MNDIYKQKWVNGIKFLQNGENKKAQELFEQCRKYYDKIGNNIGSSSCILMLAITNMAQNKDNEALKLFNEGLKIVESINYIQGIASFLMNRGILFQKMENYNIAIDDFKRSFELFNELGDRSSIKILTNLINKCNKSLPSKTE
ncbi:MAG: hypothetical protein ACTSRP_15470 [Candidatus Helarchaeota archaeon]